MANQTVYPYGTGGSLPSSIGIVNDFVTGGADKALSAEKGKELGQAVFDINDTVNIATLTSHRYSFGSNGKWSAATGYHKVIPVTPGDNINLSVVGISGSDGGFYGFLTSSYTPPSSTSDNVPYVSGTNRMWLDTGTTNLTIPEGTAYLCICTRDGSNTDKTWTVRQNVSQRNVLYKSDVVDNLISGGTQRPLSAEQGKVLSQMITGVSPIPSDLTKYQYNGPKVNAAVEQHYVATAQVATITSVSVQGGACFGNYLFMFTTNNASCRIYNLATNTLVQTITIPEEEKGFVTNCHCNTVNFGTEYYDSNDPFPLIYVSTGYASGGYSGALVYRIVATISNDVTVYSLALVQTIKITGTAWTEFIVADDGACYIKTDHYYRMPMPKLSQGDVTLDLENALQVCKITAQPSWYNGSRNQGHLYHNGKMYLVSGVPASSEKSLFIVIDLATGRREVEIDLYNTLGLHSEPEAVFIWNGHFCIVFNLDAKIYALYFE